jgi:hypothetical protein
MRAPRTLVRHAERAARDEIRHARVTRTLARRRGAAPAPVVLERRMPAPSLLDFARENAVEGCVREAFGAFVATRQASRARDPDVRRAMQRIARDETRHAALAWAIARWTAPRLGRKGQTEVRAAMLDAIEKLRGEVAGTDAGVACELGLPTAAEGRALVDAFAEACVAELA